TGPCRDAEEAAAADWRDRDLRRRIASCRQDDVRSPAGRVSLQLGRYAATADGRAAGGDSDDNGLLDGRIAEAPPGAPGADDIRQAAAIGADTDTHMSEPRPSPSVQVTATAFAALFSVVGLALYGLPLYYDFMVREFGWSRTMVTSGNALSKLVVG